MNIIIYIVATAIGFFLSFVGVVFAMLSGQQFAYVIGGLLVLAHIGSFLFVRNQAMQGKGRQAAIALASPLFVVMGVMSVFVFGGYVVSLFERDSPAFTSACKTAGAQFYKLPASPVRSLAYDWEGEYAPPFNYFTLGFGGRVSSLGIRDFPYPPAIEFTERRHSNREGLLVGAPGPYVRFPRQGAFYGIETLTADALVSYQLTPADELGKAMVEQGMVRYELTVTDRRNGEKLAFLRYIIDSKKRRACGSTGDNTLDERTFVLKAVGVQ